MGRVGVAFGVVALEFVLKVMDFILKAMDFILKRWIIYTKAMDFTVKAMDFILIMSTYERHRPRLIDNIIRQRNMPRRLCLRRRALSLEGNHLLGPKSSFF